MKQRVRVLAVLILLSSALLLGACGGGESGSGIQGVEIDAATTLGNVSEVIGSAHVRREEPPRQTLLARLLSRIAPSEAVAASLLAGIRVSVLGSSASTVTDDAGSFVLNGGFFDFVLVRFEDAGGNLLGRLTTVIPAGGSMTLHDVKIDADRRSATPATQELQYEGVVAWKDCVANRLFVASRHRLLSLPLAIDTGKMLLSEVGGRPLACADFALGDPVDVHAFLAPDGTLGYGTAVRVGG